MPFLQNGGLFIPTKKPFPKGEVLHLNISLLDEPEKYPVTSEVVWITPAGASNRTQGIGVHFGGESGRQLRLKIETYLAGALKDNKPTHSM